MKPTGASEQRKALRKTDQERINQERGEPQRSGLRRELKRHEKHQAVLHCPKHQR